MTGPSLLRYQAPNAKAQPKLAATASRLPHELRQNECDATGSTATATETGAGEAGDGSASIAPTITRERGGAKSARARSRCRAERHVVVGAVELQGGRANLYMGDPEAVQGGEWQRAAMNAYSATIGGGTSEVQHNILGERVLDLPK